MSDHERELLEEARRTLDDTASEISQAIAEMEGGDPVRVEALLSEAHTRAAVLSQRITRYLRG